MTKTPEKPKFKLVPVPQINLSEDTVRKFIAARREEKILKTTENMDYGGIVFLAFLLTAVGLFWCFLHWALYIAWVVGIWRGAHSVYWHYRHDDSSSRMNGYDHAVDVLHKAIKRGRIGIQRTSEYAKEYSLVGIYHNDLIDEDVTESIPLVEKDMIELYDALDDLSLFSDRFSNGLLDLPLPIKTQEISLAGLTKGQKAVA